MERTHGKLCTRLTDRLRGHNTDSLAHLYGLSGRHVGPVALRTHAVLALTGKNCTDLHFFKRISVLIHTQFCYALCTSRRNHMICLYKHVTFFIFDVLAREASCDTLLQALDLLIAVHECMYIHSRNLLARLYTVGIMDNQLLGYIYQTSRQITGISGTKSRIGQTFTCAMGGHKVFQYVQTFTEVGLDRQLNGTSCCISHKPTHTGKLFDLLVRTTGSGIRHHINVIIFIQTGKQRLCQFVVSCFPCLHNFFVTLFFCNKTALEILCNPVNRVLRFLNHLRLLRRNRHIRNGNCHSCAC